MVNTNEIKEKLPVIMYLHGFMSGANGAKQRQLQKQYKGRYRVIAPELDADPERSLEIINREIEAEKPEIIIGTSLGGWMALACDSANAKIVVVNPVTDPQTQLARWLNEEQTYFCKRLDGIQTYTLTSETLAKYGKYDIMRDIAASSTCGSLCSAKNRPHIYALCSTADELLGSAHAEILKDILPESQLMIVSDFGHQCKDTGMAHLFELIDGVAI